MGRDQFEGGQRSGEGRNQATLAEAQAEKVHNREYKISRNEAQREKLFDHRPLSIWKSRGKLPV